MIGLKGDQLIGSPKLSYTAAVRYDHRLTDTLDWRALLDFQHVGKSYDRYNSSPNAQEQGDYDVVNLRFTLLTQNGWEFTLFGRNLTDERGVISSQFVQGTYQPWPTMVTRVGHSPAYLWCHRSLFLLRPDSSDILMLTSGPDLGKSGPALSLSAI